MVSALERIRAIRALDNPTLRPSPYLKDRYTDEFGHDGPVRVRDYQIRGVMNLLQVQNMILGDDTGLGKTLQVLNAISYVWMLEPEYVPIVVTKKSSLYQWAAEVERFMTGIEVITVDALPHQRDAIYRNFFKNDTSKKRLLIMTYEVMWKDMLESVVRDRSKPEGKKAAQFISFSRKKLKESRKILREAESRLLEQKPLFNSHFQGRNFDVFKYVQSNLHPKDGGEQKCPPDWTNQDESMLRKTISVLRAVEVVKSDVERLKDTVAPPKVVPGIMNYAKDLLESNPGTKIFLIMDEIHYLKNYKGKIHKVIANFATEIASRRIGLTATPVKNRLMEFFSLFRIIQPDLFPKVTHFQNSFCIMKLQPIGGGRKVPIVVGHSKAQLQRFVSEIEPYYLSRRKHEVAEELPELITRELTCVLSNEQEDLYEMSELNAVASSEDPDQDRTEVLKAMTRIQQACNAPQLINDENDEPYQGPSSKMDVLLDILQDNPDAKTIVFSRFEKMISLIQDRLKKAKISCVRITGKENKAKDRENAKSTFQNATSGVNVILITTAGSESINLHAAEHIIFIDNPWSWGDYVQLLGRPIRIGSKNKVVIATHLIARRIGGAKTIDDHVIKILRSKKALADTVAGVSLENGLKFSSKDMATALIEIISQGKETKKEKTKTKKVVDIPKIKVVDIDFSDLK